MLMDIQLRFRSFLTSTSFISANKRKSSSSYNFSAAKPFCSARKSPEPPGNGDDNEAKAFEALQQTHVYQETKSKGLVRFASAVSQVRHLLSRCTKCGKATCFNFLKQKDLHGDFISVAECKSTSFIGVNDILIRETAETFGIMTREDKFRVVPKKLSVIVFEVDGWKITFQGDKLGARNLSIS